MTFFQYPQIPFIIIHSADITLLLALGALYELSIRLYKHAYQRKRALGPSPFVETAKLERAVLPTKQELSKVIDEREVRTSRTARRIKTVNLISNVAVLLMYWGVAMLAIDGSRVNDDELHDKETTDEEQAAEF
ncbi:hypothetical protein HJC23_011090 [Cyclotella cryptica]|uniref:Copper transporter n=1 Tax=Cyclotella cryptica TaxID=29204 RepID=A0ABD3P065_9STRA|eukprot:CCRYP_018848-RA/>CCRYP_018848-RA protein AED:0.17 eAED:0.22 QI:0/0/0/1/1/1/2/0/133